MENTEKRLPTLVTFRSAQDLRDAGIHFAYRKAGLNVGLLVAILSMAAVLHIRLYGADDTFMWALFGVSAISVCIAIYSSKTMEFPQFPRLSIEELETMRYDMGLRPDVFSQTYGAVLHGTPEEHRAIYAADAVISKIQNNGQK